MSGVRIWRFFLGAACCLAVHIPRNVTPLFAADDFATLKDFLDDGSQPESDGIYRSTAPRELFDERTAVHRSETSSPTSESFAPESLQTPSLPTEEVIGPQHRHERRDRLGDRYRGRTAPNLIAFSTESYRVYRSAESGWLYMPTDDLGWTSMFSSAYLNALTNPNSSDFDARNPGTTTSSAGDSSEFQANFSGAFNIHWLNGPNSVPLPPRLYDLSLGYQLRDDVNEYFSYDLSASLGLYTDFEDSTVKA